jgi:DNA-directed RNA polymerase subunit beta'
VESFETLSSIQISIASPEQIRAWSHGVVKKPETINYRTHRPERDGLFCEKIFGPTRDYECFCGKYKSIRYKGIICERCGVEVTRSSERRERMGHIELVCPVAHIWYSKGTPNYIAQLLDVSTRDFEKVLYFNSYMVLDPGNLPLLKKQILSEKEFQDYRAKYGEMFKADMGAGAIKYLLHHLDLPKLVDDLKRKLKDKSGTQKAAIIKRLEIAETFMHSKSKPEWMILDLLPVIPPDLRPMVQLDGGRFATSDLNDLYRRVINRNNRLARLIKLNAPEIIIKNEKRMLQEAVNALIDNGRRGRPVTGPGNRPLKSLNDMLKGKQGRFRQNLLGKRVDYSGRSVIVVGPKLKMHQCGLPQRMALELFKPFIMNKLVDRGYAHNIKSAKRMIEREEARVWEVLEEVVKDHPVLLNRAPTLHRHGIQAFEPVLVQGKAIQIHPLVCGAFNADFDGDQMAVHIPLLLQAKTECRVLLLASNNLLKPANGEPVPSPHQDMTIGIYYLTMDFGATNSTRHIRVHGPCERGATLEAIVESSNLQLLCGKEVTVGKGRKREVLVRVGQGIGKTELDALIKNEIEEIEIYDMTTLGDPAEVIRAYESGQIGLHDKIFYRHHDGSIHSTTSGRVIFNSVLPSEFKFHNKTVNKKGIGQIVEKSVRDCGTERTAILLDDIKDLGFLYATISGTSISIDDVKIPAKKVEIIAAAERKVANIEKRYARHRGGDNHERKQAIVDTWLHATQEVTDAMLQNFREITDSGVYNSVYVMATSGARGNVDQMKQLTGMRGLMANPQGDIIAHPITANFREGLTMVDYFISTYGARKGLVDTALRTADSGYLTRRLVDVSQDSIVFESDCETTRGVLVRPLRDKRNSQNLMTEEVVIELQDRIFGRVPVQDVCDPATGEVLCPVNYEIDAETAGVIAQSEAVVEVSKLREDCMVGETVLAPETREVICGPDVPVTAFVIRLFKEAGVHEVKVYPQCTLRSPVTCACKQGICQVCYGYDLSTNRLVDIGTTVGVIAAQSIGEPGTQLTMRTFHLGGIATAQKQQIKSKSNGVINLDELNWQFKSSNTNVIIEAAGQEDVSIEEDFEKNLRAVVLGGNLIVQTKDGDERYKLPVGSTLKATHGAKVRRGEVLVDYNPADVSSPFSGNLCFKNVKVSEDGQVVSKNAVVRVMEGNTLIGEFDVPFRAVLKVDDGDVVVAGDVIAETAREEKSAIAGVDGVVQFSNVKIKNQRVISDRGMLYIRPEKGDLEEHIINMPSGMKYSNDTAGLQETKLGAYLRVKDGDQVAEGDALGAIHSEFTGVIDAVTEKQVHVRSKKGKEYYLTGNMEIELDDEEQTLTFVSEMSGKVKIIAYRSSSNKTVDRRRIIVKDERVYVIPEGARLTFDNVSIKPGEGAEEGDRITGHIPFVTDIAGTVKIKQVTLTEVLNVLDDSFSVEDLVGRRIDADVLDAKTGEVVVEKGAELNEEQAADILACKAGVGRISVERQSTTRCIEVVGEHATMEYLVPEGAVLRVEDGAEVEASEQLIESFAPIEAETAGKINYITQYNKHTGEDLIKKIIVYSGRDYFLPVGIPLAVKNGQDIEKGDPLTDPVVYQNFNRVERGVKFFRIEESVKKYHINPNCEVVVSEGDEIKAGQLLAKISADCGGVVRVLRALTKTGKVRSIVDDICIQAGEAHQVADGGEILVKDGDRVTKGTVLAKWGAAGKKTTDIIQGLPRVSELFEVRKPHKEAVISATYGRVRLAGNNITIETPEGDRRHYKAQFGVGNVLVHDGEVVEPGYRLTEGNIDPRRLAKVAGPRAAQRYLVDEVQAVYQSQGVRISDRHIEVIVSNMLKKIQISESGDTDFLPGQMIGANLFHQVNQDLREKKKTPAVGIPVLQGITRASLTTNSFISAASFQETTRVLTKAAIKGAVDTLRGLKENIIIGKLIPAGTGLFSHCLDFHYDDERAAIEAAEREMMESEQGPSVRGLQEELEATLRAAGIEGPLTQEQYEAEPTAPAASEVPESEG